MTKLKVFSLLPALLLASIVHAWEAPEIRELSAAEIQPKHESLQPHKSLLADGSNFVLIICHFYFEQFNFRSVHGDLSDNFLGVFIFGFSCCYFVK